MWPDRGEALSRTIEAESALADLYAEALRKWVPHARDAALPVLTAAALPPNPAAVAETQTAWDQVSEAVIIAGLSVVWSAAVLEALEGIGVPLPSFDVLSAVDTIDVGTVDIVAAAVGIDRDELWAAVSAVDQTPALAAARDDFLTERRGEVAQTPAIVQAKLETVLATKADDLETAAPADAPADIEVTVSITPEDRPDMLRDYTAEVLRAESLEMRQFAKQGGYQAAGVLNHAILTAALESEREFGEELEKTWISTLDGKTRPTHWAADGQRVPLKGHFTIGGEQLSVPGDLAGSAAETKNCRCRMGILAKGEALPDEVDRHTERLDGRDSVVINRDGRTQAEEIDRRRRAGNVRARDDEDGMGRVASMSEETEMADETRIERQERAALELAASEGVDVIDEPEPDFASAITAMVAASAATGEPRLRTYDPRLFEDPKLTRPTAPTMNNETGRIYGHLAEWGHTIRGGRDATPRNRNGYRNFHTGQVQLDNGRQLSVGRLTVQGGHASTAPGVTAAAAKAHYDDVTTAFGLVRVGEDQHGIWFSGVPYPGVDPEVFQKGMVTQLSGDWRDCPGHPLDLVAAHAVNTQGFPIYSALTGPDGRELALVASLGPVRRSAATDESLRAVVDVAVSEALAEQRRADELAQRRSAALVAARELVGDPPTPSERVDESLSVHATLTAAFTSQMPAQFKKYWLSGAGAAKIRWGTSGDFNRCVRAINSKIVENGQKPLPDSQIKGLCAALHKEATGATPGNAPGEKRP